MKFYFNLALCVMLLAGCRSEHTIEVTNYSDFARSEIVEADMSEIENIFGKSQFRILDPEGNEIPYQVTYDKKLIFPLPWVPARAFHTPWRKVPRRNATLSYAVRCIPRGWTT